MYIHNIQQYANIFSIEHYLLFTAHIRRKIKKSLALNLGLMKIDTALRGLCEKETTGKKQGERLILGACVYVAAETRKYETLVIKSRKKCINVSSSVTYV